MTDNARDAYLEAQVMTATPQKLRLMLIDGAIRFAREALEGWTGEDKEQGHTALLRCRSVVAELISSIRGDGTELTKTVTGVYLFLYQTLTEAQVHCDTAKLAEAIKVLEVERETWRLVCEKMPEAPDPHWQNETKMKEITASDAAAIPPGGAAPTPLDTTETAGGFSLDA